MPRKHERANVPLGVVLEMSSGRHEARISDLSMSGCFVDTIMNAQPGERINLKIQISQTKSLDITSDVQHLLPGFGFGVQFINMSKEDKEQLAQIISVHGANPWKSDDV